MQNGLLLKVVEDGFWGQRDLAVIPEDLNPGMLRMNILTL